MLAAPINPADINTIQGKDERGTPDRRGSPDRTGSRGRILLNSGNGPVRGPGNGSGRERGSFLSVRVFFYGPGLNFGSSEIIYTNE